MRKSETPTTARIRRGFHRRQTSLRAALIAAGLLLGTSVSLVGSIGCGGGGRGNMPSVVANASGRAVISVRWPERGVTRGRLVPLAAESIRVTVLQDDAPLEERLLTRPAGNSSVTTTAEFPLLPTGNLRFRAEAYPNADGTGVLQARAEGVTSITADVVTPIQLTLASTIDQIEVTPTNPVSLRIGKTTTLTATAKNAAGEIVITGPSTWQWTSGNTAVATVDASSGLVTAITVGTATIEATETESGKRHQVTLQIEAGPPPRITTTPSLSPAFDPAITDYVVPAGTNTSVQFAVEAPEDTTVAVDGQSPQGLTFTTQVNNLGAGQRFSFVVNSPSGAKTYHVRRLPANFPTWATERFGTPQSEYYVFAPNLPNDTRNYVIIADNYGVPVWWFRTAIKPIDPKLLPNGNLAWLSFATNSTGVERTVNGALVRMINRHPSVGGDLDFHELLLLPNGNYLFFVNINRGPVDLTPYGGPANGTILDHVIEEVTPAGTLVWQWSALDHIPIAETSPNWWPQITDPYHMNSVELDGDGYILSLRHQDAIYRIDRATGGITWKLGGTPRPESLAFIGDELGAFGGQHDARILPDGTLTLFDNGTHRHAPRSVRYRIDTAARTATLLEQVTDSAALSSGLVGSARKLPEGNWVTNWGGNPFFTEQTPDSSVVLRMTFPNAWFSYRAAPIPVGTLPREVLRNGMDTQFPR